MLYELSENEKNNIHEFLRRADLKGREVDSYNRIISALNKPIEEKSEKSTN